jgi:hypothetical protein
VNALTIDYSDINFAGAVGSSFTNAYSVNLTGAAGGTTRQTAWVGINTLFDHSSQIGTFVGDFTSPGVFSGTTSGGSAPTNPFSLTLQQVFDAHGGNVTFSVDGSITSVPEPGAIVLFGSVLALCASRLRRRQRA